MASIDVRQGRTRAWTGTVKDSAGNALTNTYSGSETLSVSLWPVGDTNASTLTTSSVVWLNATSATVTITLTQADTAALAAGIYESNITVSAGGSIYDAFDSLVIVKPSKSNAAWLVQPLEVVASWAGFADLDDAEQIQLIEAATDSIESVCRRTFAPTTYTETYNGPGLPRLWLRQRPIISVTSVMLGSSVLAATDYTLDANLGCLWYGDDGGGAGRHRSGWQEGVQNITVVYRAGFSPIPASVKRAAIVQCKHLSDTSRASSVYQFESIGDYQYKRAEIGANAGLAPDVSNLLRGYIAVDL
jgi:hypothetical protein